MSSKSYDDMEFAKLDTDRELRQNVAEVVFCEGKEDEHLVKIFRRLYEQNGQVLGTRASAHQYDLVKEIIPEVEYDETSRILKVEKEKELIGNIAIVTAGTADIKVAEEAAQTAEFLGAKVNRIFDVGVSGIHRLLDKEDEIREANVVIAIAGMEGAEFYQAGGVSGVEVAFFVDWNPVYSDKALGGAAGYGVSGKAYQPLYQKSASDGVVLGLRKPVARIFKNYNVPPFERRPLPVKFEGEDMVAYKEGILHGARGHNVNAEYENSENEYCDYRNRDRQCPAYPAAFFTVESSLMHGRPRNSFFKVCSPLVYGGLCGGCLETHPPLFHALGLNYFFAPLGSRLSGILAALPLRCLK